ncbi:MAG: alkaline phosphatase family protein [Pirellulaceae bacterium]
MSSKRKVLLIGWDAADWEHIDPLLEAGLMPTLDRMINEGVMGNLATLEPILSPMLWNSVATGMLPEKHGIHGFIEPDPVNGGARPYTSTSRKVKALWNILTQSGLKSNIIGWWASHPAEPIDGCIVTNHFTGIKYVPNKGWHVAPGTIYPADRTAFLSQFRVLPQELTHEHIFPFIPHADRLDQQNDSSVQVFGRLLSDCASMHAVATVVMETEPWDFMAVYYDSIDHCCHAFMPFHPPKLPHVSDEQFELYKDVVSGAYRFHDLMLARLLELAGPETTVLLCSDHGFQSRHLRPQWTPREPAGPAAWHREFGIFVAKGPGIKRDERVYGASLIDVGPTVLHAFGLPIGQDMDGRPLVEIYEQAGKIEVIPSWEDVPGPCGRHLPNTAMKKEDSEELMQQFVALGYIEDPGDDKEKAAENAEIESKYNLCRSLLWTNQSDKALVLMEDLCRRRPWETRFLNVLAHAYHASGYQRQAERLIGAMYPAAASIPTHMRMLLGEIKHALGELQSALELFQQVGQQQQRMPRLHIRLGRTYLRLRRFTDAEAAFRKALEVDEDAALAWQGLSTVYRRLGKNQETADAALTAVGLIHRLPEAHFNLGVALARSGDTARAIVALETALKFRPAMVQAHRWLSLMYATDPVQSHKATFHRLEVARRGLPGHRRTDAAKERREMLFDLPDIPSIEERLKILNQERPIPAAKQGKSGKSFVLVSGLPRSGTSLMMQMLAAGGMSIVTDGERAADIDNPKGYYEWEKLKQIAQKPELLDDETMNHKAIKCLSVLLKKMPPQHDYRVIFMMRPIEEIVASQAKMIQRLETEGAKLGPQELMRGLGSHRDETVRWLNQVPHMTVLECDYPTLVGSPRDVLPQIVEFVGAQLLPFPEKMLTVIEPELYRQQV